MRLKELFTVAAGQKVTEKHMRRVLISSICSILLCMSCLVGTTWAWFVADVENTGNVIRIGSPEIELTVNGGLYEAGKPLTGSDNSEYKISMKHANKEDDLDKKSVLYVTLNITHGENTTAVYTALNHDNGYQGEIVIAAQTECAFTWIVSWFAPSGAEALEGNVIAVEDSAEAAEPSGSEEEKTSENQTGSAEGEEELAGVNDSGENEEGTPDPAEGEEETAGTTGNIEGGEESTGATDIVEGGEEPSGMTDPVEGEEDLTGTTGSAGGEESPTEITEPAADAEKAPEGPVGAMTEEPSADVTGTETV